MLVAVRGATTVEEDNPDLICRAVTELMDRLITDNGIQEEDVVNIFLSVTQDIHSFSPAKAIRLHLGWVRTPIMSAVEPDIDGLLGLCIRVLMQINTEIPRADIKHAYLNGASILRPDLKQT